MEKKKTIIFLIIIMFLGFFIYKTLFSSLGTLMYFLITSFLIGIFWNSRQSPIVLIVIKKVENFPYWSAIFSIALYSVLILPIEFLITEVLYKIPKIPDSITVTILVLFGLVFTFVDWKKIMRSKIMIAIAVMFLFLSSFVYLKYREEKLSREYLPKIYKISPSWGVQAQIIKLEGVNFGPSWKGGKVILGNLETTIKEWNDNVLLVEQPVRSPFGLFNFKVVRKDGKESNLSLPYEVRNPDDL